MHTFLCVEIIENCQQSIEYYIDSEQSLEIDEDEPDNETIIYEESSESEEDVSPEVTGESSQSESIPSSLMKKPKRMISLEDKKKAVDFWKSGETKRLSLTTLSNTW
jgi:CCR4-NOT transcriptional regulation complex NOT5 subunit